jgi:SAM-dependent methyltransferase
LANVAKSTEFARCGPVHFQPLEGELDAVRCHFLGRVLNAGCGHRDITALLRDRGATEVVNFDLASSIPGAILGSLAKMPFADNEFDTVYCNAVLEHVPAIDRVMSELTRVLRPGGSMIVGVPFLQPFHDDPTDFRRYTRDGLRELGELYGLRQIESIPVHSITQTLGWIAWSWATEKGGWRPFVSWPIIWLATRIFYRSDPTLVRNGNTFLAVYTKTLVPLEISALSA